MTRIRQEILLGVGGLRALRALGIRPAVLHLNEGHSAFAVLERARERVEEDGLASRTPCAKPSLQTVFTTHTPGRGRSRPLLADLVERELGWLRAALRLDRDR